LSKLIILLFSGAKFSKVLISIGSMLLTIWVYAQIYGAPFAAGFVVMLLIHEMGHYLAARQRGLDVGLPAFIPFVGAYINLREHPHNAETEAYVAYAGPFVGSLAAFAAFYQAHISSDDFWMALAYSGFMLNLFNMLPISPLDGGRITQVLSPRIWLLGAPMLAALFFYQPSPMLVLIGIMALPSLLAAWRYDPRSPEALAYQDMPEAKRYEYVLMYFGLTAFLAIMTYQSHLLLKHGAM
jgi:Zn-dependent protease